MTASGLNRAGSDEQGCAVLLTVPDDAGGAPQGSSLGRNAEKALYHAAGALPLDIVQLADECRHQARRGDDCPAVVIPAVLDNYEKLGPRCA
jgi:hypothetical protein